MKVPVGEVVFFTLFGLPREGKLIWYDAFQLGYELRRNLFLQGASRPMLKPYIANQYNLPQPDRKKLTIRGALAVARYNTGWEIDSCGV